jgi:serine/threonine-protein kinase
MGACAQCGQEHEGACATVADAPTAEPAAIPRVDPQAINASDAASARLKGDSIVPGTQIGDYVVTGKIGEGGMGAVYSAVHPVIGKRAAIKVPHLTLSGDMRTMRRFIQEARAVNQIGHRNIVDIFGFGELTDGRQYIIMELLAGESLAERLRKGPMSWDEAFTLLIDVAGALEAAHKEGIVHRDLKPDNIFLAANRRGDRVVKLLDFGIAKLAHGGVGGLHTTKTGAQIGTPYYMAPEQCLGREVDARADLYSYGVVMFEIFTGRVPFIAQASVQVMSSHVSEPPPRPSELSEIPAELERSILECLAKQPEERPASIKSVGRALEQIARKMGIDPVGGLRVSRQKSSKPIQARRQAPTVSDTRSDTPQRSRRAPGRVWVASALIGGIAAAVVTLVASRSTAPTAPAAHSPDPTVILQVVTDPPGALVAINGEVQTFRTPATFPVRRGRAAAVHVERDGFRPADRSVALGDGPTAIDIHLEPIRIEPAHLSLRTNAPHAAFKLDGAPVGDGSGTLIVEKLVAGTHRLAIEARGFQPREELILVKAGELASLEWSLVPVGGTRAKAAPPASSSPAPAKAPDDNDTSGWPPN